MRRLCRQLSDAADVIYNIEKAGVIHIVPTIDKRKTGNNLRRIMDEHKITVKDVQEYLGLGSVQSVYHWLNGISVPSVDNLYALSGLFQVSMDSLVCGSRPPVSLNFDSIADENTYQRMRIYYIRICEKYIA